MDTKVDVDITADPDAWTRALRNKREEQVAALVADGVAGRLWKKGSDLTRDEHDDEILRWLFWRQNRTDRPPSDLLASPDSYLYDGVTSCMTKAREDERKRIAKALSAGLKALLGDEFFSVMYDIAEVNDINIGRD